MTVILLDPLRPELLPLAAIKFVSGPIIVTEDVHPTTLWALPNVTAAYDDDGDPLTVLLSTDPTHPLVRTRVDRGEVLIGAHPQPGHALLEAVALMDTLRRNGPWESTQTHESLRRYLLEEVYELLDAIDVGTPADLREELGDLLLQVLFHARIAADDPHEPFDIDDVARAFVAKVSHRTPGILSGEHSDLETQIREWEERKAAEKQRGSILDGIATTAPALSLAQKVLERLSAAHFPAEAIDPGLLTITVGIGGRSVEDLTRQRVLDLIDHVHAAEESARVAGQPLTSEPQWLHFLAVADGQTPTEPAGDARPVEQHSPAPAIDADDVDTAALDLSGLDEAGQPELDQAADVGDVEASHDGDVVQPGNYEDPGDEQAGAAQAGDQQASTAQPHRNVVPNVVPSRQL